MPDSKVMRPSKKAQVSAAALNTNNMVVGRMSSMPITGTDSMVALHHCCIACGTLLMLYQKRHKSCVCCISWERVPVASLLQTAQPNVGVELC
jgi:hypothetical protein